MSGLASFINADFQISELVLNGSMKSAEKWTFRGSDVIMKGNRLYAQNCTVELTADSGKSVISGKKGVMVMHISMELQGNVVYEDGNRTLKCDLMQYSIAGDRMDIPGDFTFIDKVKGTSLRGRHLTAEKGFSEVVIGEIISGETEINKKNGR